MSFARNLALGALGAAAAGVAGLAIYSARESDRISRRVPADGKFLDIAGAAIHFRDEGSGPPIVIVHGLAGQMRNFSYALLDRLTPHFRVILVDRPGSGYSTLPPGPHPGIPAQAAILAEFIRKMKLDRPLLVGHSLGGAIALALAAAHPDLVCGLALISPLTQLQSHVPEPFRALTIRPALLRDLAAWTIVLPLAPLAGDAGLKVLFEPDTAPRDFGYACGGALPLRPRSFIAASNDLAACARDMRGIVAEYPKLKLPVEVLFGRGDAVLSATLHGEGLCRAIPHARLTLIEGGHMIPVTAPDKVAVWIAEVYTHIELQSLA